MPLKVDHDERRREIARVVEDIVLDRGIEAVTIRDVAGRVGFSTTVVSHYFRTKLEMLVFTHQEARRRAEAAVRDAVRDGASLMACAELLLPLTDERWRDWHTWFAFWGMTPAEPSIDTERRTGSESAATLFEEVIAALRAAGRLDPAIAPAEAAIDLQLIINGIASLVAQDRPAWPADRQKAELRRQLSRAGLGDR